MPASNRTLRVDLEWRTTLFTLVLLPVLVGLGSWQLQRAEEKALLATSWEQRQSQPPAPLAQLWQHPAETLAYRPVTLSGDYVEGKYFLLDNRIKDGRFGYEVLAVMKLAAGGGFALVNRGWLAGDPARQELPVVPAVAGRVEVTGHVYVAPGAPYLLAEQSLDQGWPTVLQALEIDKILPYVEQDTGSRVFPYSIRIAAGQPGALAVDWQVVNVSPDKHRAYAAQWFTMAFVLLILFVLRSSNLLQWLKPSPTEQR